MAYYGNQPTVGQNQSFKVLDDISSYTETFDATSTAVVSAANDTLTFYDHRFVQGQRVTYTHGGGAVINGLATATAYYVIRQDKDTIQLATNATNAANGTAIDISLSGTSGTAHTLNIAFDGTNTKFKATYQTGYHVKLTRAAQLQIAINGVVQEPVDSTSPSNGFGIDSNNVIVFSAAPVSTDDFWGTFLASNLPSWEISDNKVDNFDGNSTATNFTLSKLPANNENVLVTVNGVVQHPSDATTTRAYKLIGQEIVFTDAPLTGEAIQVRHIGFAGAAAGGVTGFYGRTGNVTLTSADDVTINNITGVAATFTGNVSIGGTLTYQDVTSIDAVGIITAQQGIHIGAGATAGAIDVTTGIATFSSVGIADSIYHIGDGDTSLKFGTDTLSVKTAGNERLLVQAAGIVKVGDTFDVPTIRRQVQNSNVLISGGNATNDGANLNMYGSAHSSQASNFEFRTGSTERLKILSGGGVGIGDSIYHLGDDNTQIRFPAADTVTVETAGSERLRIEDGGKIGMGVVSTSPGGTCNPDGNQLLIRGPSTFQTTKGHIMLTGDGATVGEGPQIVFSESGSGGNFAGAYIGHVRAGSNSVGHLVFGTRESGGDANTVPTERLRIRSDGRIGINTTEATSILQIYGTNNGEGTATGQLTLKDTAAYNASPTSGIIFQGHHASNNAQAIWSSIRGFKANAGDGDYDGCLAFDVRKHGAVAYEAMRIDEDGDVGIGTQNPGNNNERLIVSKNYAAADGSTTIGIHNLHHTGSSSASSGQLNFMFSNYNASHEWWGGRILCYSSDNYNQYTYLRFDTANAGNASGKMWIKHDGKVGIGTEIPDETLELFKASGTNIVKVSSEANSTIGLEIEKTGSTTQSWRIADGQTVNGTLEFYDKTEGETRLAIDGSSRVIIGQASHAGGGALVVCGNSNTPNSYSSASFCKIGANPTSGTTLANLRFNGGTGGTNRAAEINVKCDANWAEGSSQASKMELGVADSGGTTANTPSLTLKAGGNVEINRGDLVMANGFGIDFGAQTSSPQSGTSTDNERFDHYEEGDWTPEPIITHQGGSGALSSIQDQYGRYVRSGNLVRVWFYFKFTASAITNCNVGVSGLPFTISNDGQWNNGFHGGIARRGVTGGETYICEGMYKNTTNINVLRKYNNYGFENTTQSVGGTAAYLVD